MSETHGEAALPLERYAEIAAHVAHFEGADQAEVVERLGAKSDDYASAQKAWTRAIGAELRRDETALAGALAEVFGRTRQRLDDEKPALASIGPRAAEARAPAPVIAPPIADEVTEPAEMEPPPVTAPVAPVHAELPTFLQTPAAHPMAAPVPMAAEAHAPPPMVAPPPMAPPVQKSPFAQSVSLGSTAVGPDIQQIARSILPFGAKPAAGRPPAEAASTAARPPSEAPGFGASSPAAPPPATPHTPFSTGETDVRALTRQVLPFGGGAARPEPPGRPPPRLTIEQYASLVVDTELDPADAAAIARRYGLTPEQRSQVDASFRETFRAHPEQHGAFERARQAYRAWREQTRNPRR